VSDGCTWHWKQLEKINQDAILVYSCNCWIPYWVFHNTYDILWRNCTINLHWKFCLLKASWHNFKGINLQYVMYVTYSVMMQCLWQQYVVSTEYHSFISFNSFRSLRSIGLPHLVLCADIALILLSIITLDFMDKWWIAFVSDVTLNDYANSSVSSGKGRLKKAASNSVVREGITGV
jgi:hypothetical protein